MVTKIHFRIGFDYITETSRSKNRTQLYLEQDRITLMLRNLITRELLPHSKAVVNKYMIQADVSEDPHTTLEDHIVRAKEEGQTEVTTYED